MFISHYNGHGIKLVRPLSTVDNIRDYARVSHSRQWSNYNLSCLMICYHVPSHFVEFLVLLQFFLLTLQCAQTIIYVLQQLLNLLTLSLCNINSETYLCRRVYLH